MEEAAIGSVNCRALSIHVLPDQIEFVVRLQVRFAGLTPEQAGQQFPTVRQNLMAGIAQIWSQRLSRLPSLVRGREFEVTPQVELIPADAPRNPDYWLVDVDPAVTRAVTDPFDGTTRVAPGTDSATLGHESLHLFGLIDRYADNKRTHRSVGFRGTASPTTSSGITRGDPLDIGHGPILPEDLEYLFVQLDVYERAILADMPPNHVALLRQLGWGYAPRLRDLIQRTQNLEDSQRAMLDAIVRAMDQVTQALSVETERARLRRETELPVPAQ
jgi:hypothetical protein